MRKLAILLTVLLVSCGLFQSKTKTEIMANEPAKLEVGQQWRYKYVTSESSRVVKDSEILAVVEAMDEYEVTLRLTGYVKLTVGEVPINSVQKIPREVLKLEYLEELRKLTGVILPNVVIQWLGWTTEGCDLLEANNISGAQNVKVTAKLCAQSLTIPNIWAQVEDLGIKIAYANVL